MKDILCDFDEAYTKADAKDIGFCGSCKIVSCEKNQKNLKQPTLKNYVARYCFNKKLLDKNQDPRNREMLERKIKENERDIIAYVTSDEFVRNLGIINL